MTRPVGFGAEEQGSLHLRWCLPTSELWCSAGWRGSIRVGVVNSSWLGRFSRRWTTDRQTDRHVDIQGTPKK